MGCLLSCVKTVEEDEPTFNPEEDAKKLDEALKGEYSDVDCIIDIVTDRTNQQRQQIKETYLNLFGKSLMDQFQVELRSYFKDCCIALFETPAQYDAKWLRKAMAGLGTNDAILIEIMCTRTNDEINEIKEVYESEFERDLADDIKSETSGHFKKLLVSLCQADREETTEVDHDRACKEARELYEAGEKRWGTDESKFNEILAGRSFPQLRATFDEYDKICKYNILQSIDREMSGDLRDGLKAIVICVRNSGGFFAGKINKCMKGLGTDDDSLIRIIVSRSEINMEDIKSSYQAKYEQPLYKVVEQDASIDYRKLLAALVGKD